MGYTNPYIQEVLDHPRILTESEEIRSQKGKWTSFFSNDLPITLEIGTGMGNFLSRYVQAHPDENIIGMEIKYKRLMRTIGKCDAAGREDIILIKEFGEKIGDIFAPGEIQKVFLYFPDPWPRKKHWKHRILQTPFLDALHDVLTPDGVFEFKTDHEQYFVWGKSLFADHPGFEITDIHEDFEGDKKFAHTNSTEFEMIWRTQGKKVMMLSVKRV